MTFYSFTPNNLPRARFALSLLHKPDPPLLLDFAPLTTTNQPRSSPNRNSMPVSSYDRKRSEAPDLSSILGAVNTSSFMFGGDNDRPTTSKSTTTSPDSKTYLQLKHTADGFPKLIRREDNTEIPFTVASQALDLASHSADAEQQQQPTDSAPRRHRISLPPSAFANNGMSQLDSVLAGTENKQAAGNRRSMEVRFAAEASRPGLTSPPRGPTNGVPKAHPSYSANDIPTLKSINGTNGTNGSKVHSPSNHVANLSNGTSPQRHSESTSSTKQGTVFTNDGRQHQEFTNATTVPAEGNDGFNPQQSGLQASATPFSFAEGPPNPSIMSPYAQAPFQQPYYAPFPMPMLTNGFNNMNMIGAGYGGPGQWPAPVSTCQQNGYSEYQQGQQQRSSQAGGGAGRFGDSQRSVMQQRRAQNEDANSRFANVTMNELHGQIYDLCKDQHGCRFLQKKLEERDEGHIQHIFEEVKDHVTELMIDPFGNYLCQKLLENTNDEQRTVLIQNSMPAMTAIALNQHGTRALQKMIEFISTPQQTMMIIEALRNDVVQLIQDLNGNHVIQKCLNHLAAPDAQFIFDATALNCVAVGTHRHGCCVLQRCIDHASGDQKAGLIKAITANAFKLVQDPFGNYVVQYILDLDEPEFTEPLCRSFSNSVVFLSKQKFSSNVIEKCIRCAKNGTKRMLIEEIVPPTEVEKMLRDSFANYVVQTAMDFADPDVKAALIDSIRPIVPSIRHTPYGRRIQSKIQEYDGQSAGSGPASGMVTPATGASPGSAQYSNHQTPNGGRANRQGFIGSPPNWGGVNTGTLNGVSFASPFNHDQQHQQQPDAIAGSTPQRNNPAYAMLNGAQNYQNHGFGGPVFVPGRQAQAGYGQF